MNDLLFQLFSKVSRF